MIFRSLASVAGLCFFALALPLGAQQSLRLHPMFGDHMVLPRDTTIRIRGQAPPRTVVKVTTSWLEDSRQGMANDDGAFEVSLPTPAAGGPHRIELRGAGERIDLDDLASGDLWLASGQSNMEWILRRSPPDLARAIEIERERDARETLSLVRYLDVARRPAARRLATIEGAWSDVTVDRLPEVSAVAYFFAREVADATGIPIGIVGSNWGGTPAHAWTSAAALRELGLLGDRLDAIAAAARDFDESPAGYARRLAAWRRALREADPGFAQGWAEDDGAGDWSPRADLSLWREPELADFDGAVWFRGTLELPADAPRRGRIEFGPVDDQDLVFINGREIGGREEGTGWNQPRRYAIPAGVLRPGPNRIVLRVLDTGGAGGVTGDPDANRVVLADGRVLPLAGPWGWRKGAALSDLPPLPRRTLCGPGDPAALFRGMIAPLDRFPMRGVIWYQGESDVGQPERYARLFPAMIRDWRRAFANDALSFYFVQIAPFAYREGLDSAALREAQEAALALPATGMAVTLDVGDAGDIHPRRKQTVGHRLALHALAKDYGIEGLRPDAPRFRRARRVGDEIHLEFDHAEGGLVARGPLKGFELARAGAPHAAVEARIEGTRVILAPLDARGPLDIRYAWSNVPEPCLFDRDGLPAPSFRTRLP